jgi:hypothetical protein
MPMALHCNGCLGHVQDSRGWFALGRAIAPGSVSLITISMAIATSGVFIELKNVSQWMIRLELMFVSVCIIVGLNPSSLWAGP